MLEKLKSIFTRRPGNAQRAEQVQTIRHRPATNVIMPSSRAAEIAAQSRGRNSFPQAAAVVQGVAQGVSALRMAGVESDTSLARAQQLPKTRIHISSGADGNGSLPAADLPEVNRVAAVPAAPVPMPDGAGTQNGETPDGIIPIGFGRIIQRFPQELSELVLAEAPEDAFFSFEIERAIQQLPRGAVTVTFGELRLQAPAGLLADAPQYDEVHVALPLGEIISRITPAKLNRRSAQKQIIIPEDVTAPFQAPAQSKPKPAAAAPSLPASRSPAPSPAPAPQLNRPATPPPRPTISTATQAAPMPQPANRAASSAAPALLVSAPPRPAAPKVAAPAPMPVASKAPAASTATGTMKVELHRVLDGWPQVVQEEITGLGLQDQVIEMPMSEVEDGLRTGRLLFTWSQVRGWMPAVSCVLASSPNDTAPIELPLKVIAPLFLAQRKQPAAASAAPVARGEEFESIPNLFGGKHGARAQVSNAAPVAPAPQAAPSAAIPAPSLPAPSFPPVARTAPMAAPQPRPVLPVMEKVPKTMADVFGTDPGANATPAEIARRTSSLAGVAGVVVCTPDGLAVAEHFASPVGGETFCALMTQMYHRIANYAKELKLASPSQTSFTVDEVQYLMIQTPRIFLIAVGKPKAELPLASLKIVARHLGE